MIISHIHLNQIKDIKSKEAYIDSITIDDKTYNGTPSLSRSIVNVLGTDQTIYRHFSGDELVGKLRRDNSMVQLITEERGGGNYAVALVPHKTNLITHTEAREVMSSLGGQVIEKKYADGNYMLLHVEPSSITIDGQEFKTGRSLTIDDAWVRPPEVQALFIRQVCSNGAIVSREVSEAGQIQIGNDRNGSLDKAVRSYQLTDAIKWMVPALAQAYATPASGDEVHHLESLLHSSRLEMMMNGDDQQLRQPRAAKSKSSRFLNSIRDYTGTAREHAQRPTWSSVSTAVRMITPTNASLGNLFDMATELATHHARTRGEHVALQEFTNRLLISPDLKPTDMTPRRVPARFFPSGPQAQPALIP